MPGTRRKARGRAAAVVALAVAGAALLLLGAALWRVRGDPVEHYLERRGTLASFELTEWVARGELWRADGRAVSTSGLAVSLAVLRPAPTHPRPLLVLLGGERTGRRAVDLLDRTGGAVVVALDWPLAGARPRGLGLVPAVPRLQDALRDVAPAVSLAVDALVREDYVDPERVELVGVSLGAIFGAMPGALDPRFRRVWLLHGAGDPTTLLEASLGDVPWRPLRRLAARAIAALADAGDLAPERWVGRIAPQKLVLVNAESDERLPARCIEALHAAAPEAERVWVEGAHVRPSRREVVRELVRLVTERLEELPP